MLTSRPLELFFFLGRFSPKPAPLFRLGLLHWCGLHGRLFFLRSRLFLLCLYALWFCSFWLWLGFFLLGLLLLSRLLLNNLRHINPLDERHLGGVAFTLAKFHDARVSPIAFR